MASEPPSPIPAGSGRVAGRDLSIAIPCFNEEPTIDRVLCELEQAFPDAEILVVDDGSTDNTQQIVLRHAGVRLLSHDRNRGYGAAIKTACLHASREYIVWYDADGQHHPDMIRALLEPLPAYDCVIGARTFQAAVPSARALGVFCLRWTARLLTQSSVPDLNSGLRVFRLALLRRYLRLLPDGFSASTTTTILMLERGYRVCWTKIATAPRRGKSNVRVFRDGIKTMLLILHLVVLFNPLKFFLPLSVGLSAAGLIYGVVRALGSGRGFPTLAGVVVLVGVQTFLFGLLADQISALRKQRYEDPADDPPARSSGGRRSDGSGPSR
jgi:glycosyltransferase involved in cell wall biosynthesis